MSSPVYTSPAALAASTEGPRGVGAAWQAGDYRYTELPDVAPDPHLVNAALVKLQVVAIDGAYDLAACNPPSGPGSDVGPVLRALVATQRVSPVTIRISQGEHRIGSEVQTRQDVRLIDGGGRVVPDFGPAGGTVFRALAGSFLFDAHMDGGMLQSQVATGNLYGIVAGHPRAPLSSVEVGPNARFTNLLHTDGHIADGKTGTGEPNLNVFHALYVNGADRAVFRGSVSGVSGAAVFIKHCKSARIVDATLLDTRWYTINLDYDCTDTRIENCTIRCDLPGGTYWGGMINTVGTAGFPPNVDTVVRGNVFGGRGSYGGIIRSQSDQGLLVEDNDFDLCDVGDWGSSEKVLTLIRVTSRTYTPAGGAPYNSLPPRNIVIRNNRALRGIAGGAFRAFIYVTCDQPGDGRRPLQNLTIEGNVCRSPSPEHRIESGIILHGLTAGMETVVIRNNDCEVRTRARAPVPGGIGLVTSGPSGTIDGVVLGGNRIVNVGVANTSAHVGLAIGAHVDNVRQTAPNTVQGFFHGVRTFKGAGPTLIGLDKQQFSGNARDTLLEHPLSK